jgi:hypothetical protein
MLLPNNNQNSLADHIQPPEKDYSDKEASCISSEDVLILTIKPEPGNIGNNSQNL